MNTELKLVGDMTKITVGPNDVLVVTLPKTLSTIAAEYIKEHIQSVFGPEQRVLILDSGAQIGVVSAELPAPDWADPKLVARQAAAHAVSTIEKNFSSMMVKAKRDHL